MRLLDIVRNEHHLAFLTSGIRLHSDRSATRKGPTLLFLPAVKSCYAQVHPIASRETSIYRGTGLR